MFERSNAVFAEVILTPNKMEFDRMCEALDEGTAASLARKLGVTVPKVS